MLDWALNSRYPGARADTITEENIGVYIVASHDMPGNTAKATSEDCSYICSFFRLTNCLNSNKLKPDISSIA
ncbi:hypothetical protein ACFLYR_05340 [Chloroflexota bacterium]